MTNPWTATADPVPAPTAAPTGQWLAGGQSASATAQIPTSNWGDLGTVENFAQPEEIRGHTGGGFYPDLEDLLGRLVLIRPLKIERIAQKEEYVKKGSDGMVDRGSCDLVVLDGEPLPTKDKDGNPGPALEIPADLAGKQFFQTKIVDKIRGALRDGIPVLLGRIVRVPQWPDVKAGRYEDGDYRAIEAAIAAWLAGGARGEKPKSAWSLANHTPEEEAIALAWMNEQARKASEARAASIG